MSVVRWKIFLAYCKCTVGQFEITITKWKNYSNSLFNWMRPAPGNMICKNCLNWLHYLIDNIIYNRCVVLVRSVIIVWSTLFVWFKDFIRYFFIQCFFVGFVFVQYSFVWSSFSETSFSDTSLSDPLS
jgi:hypothetical protein